MRFLSLDNAVANAQRRANSTGWVFSVIEVVNIHTRDYEYEVLSFVHERAVRTIHPN